MNPVYVFLDFDGVTHPWGEVEDFRCLPELETVLRDYPETRVVIASDWRTLFSLPKLAARFSEDIRPRVIDTTPTIFPRKPDELYGLREREAHQWLARKGGDAQWLAIDDAPGNVDGARAVGMSAVLIGQQRADVPAALAELRSLVAL